MLWTAVLYLALLGKAVRGNWEDGSDDPTFSNLGFYVRNITCNDGESQCMDCLTVSASAIGYVFLHTFTYSEQPYKFLFTSTTGSREWKILHMQEDRYAPFRLCIETEDPETKQPGHTSPEVVVCMDNIFSGISVPAECPKPTVVITLTDVHENVGWHGQQVVYCVPQKD